MAIGLTARADGDGEHRAPAGEAASLESLAARIRCAISQNPIEPALQHGWREVPPHRILQDQQIAAVHDLQLIPNHFGKGAGHRCVPLLSLNIETSFILPLRKMLGALGRVEA